VQATEITRPVSESPGDIEEVAVRGGRLQLLVPSACSNVRAAVSNLVELSAGSHLLTASHEAVLQRMHTDILSRSIGIHNAG
jgi:hypothetical protein